MHLWVGPGIFAGPLTSLTLCFLGMAQLLLQFQSMMIDGTLKLREKTLSTGFAAVLWLSGCLILGHWFGLCGIACAGLFSRLVLWVRFRWVLASHLRRDQTVTAIIPVRALLACIGIVSISAMVPSRPASWVGFIFQSIAVLSVTSVASYFLVLSVQRRRLLLSRITAFRPLSSRSWPGSRRNRS